MLKETWLYALLLLLPLAFDPAEKISNRLPDASDSTVTEKHFTEKNFAGVAPYSNHEGCPNSKIPPGAAPAFPKLIKEDHTYEYPPKKKLPRLAVVTVAFGTSANNYRGELSAIACYCALHGLPFYVEHVQLQPDRYFSFSKTRAVMKYLPHFEWILYIDNDCVIVNRTRSLEEFIDDNYDLVLQKRDSNHEVHAAVFFVKNSPYGWYFMRKWIALSDNGEAPFNMGDNAALVVLSLLELKPEGHERCLQIIADSKTETDSRVRRKNYNSEFLDCYASLMRNVDIYAMENVKVLPPLRGFLRSYDRGWTPAEYFARLFPEDFILHGKQMDLLTAEDIYCLPEKEGGSNSERYHTRDSAIKASARMGFWWYAEETGTTV